MKQIIRVSQAEAFRIAKYAPHALQRQTHAAARSHRFRVIDAGRRTGKSVIGGHDLYSAVYQCWANLDQYDPHEKRAEYWIVGPGYTDAEKEFRVLYAALKRVGAEFDHPGTYYDSIGG